MKINNKLTNVILILLYYVLLFLTMIKKETNNNKDQQKGDKHCNTCNHSSITLIIITLFDVDP